jgi:hypothetical protein
MPRIKLKKTKRVQWVAPQRLSDALRSDLLEIWGLDLQNAEDQRNADLGLQSVERALAHYDGLRTSMDNAPRAAHHLEGLRRLSPLLGALEDELSTLDGDLNSLYHYAGVDIETFSKSLDQFLSATYAIGKQLEKCESRHAPRKVARHIVAVHLARIFLHFRPSLTDANDREVSPDMELKTFVKTALMAKGITPPSPQNWSTIIKAAKEWHQSMIR